MKRVIALECLLMLSVYSLSQVTFVNYPNSGQYNDAFSAIAFDENNNVWVGTLLNGLHCLKGGTYQDFNIYNCPLPHNKIYDLLYSSDNQLWVATLNGLALVKNNIWTIYTTENSNLPSNTIISLGHGAGGRIWIGTDKGIIDAVKGKVYNSENTPLKGEVIYHIFTDTKENTWFATNEEVARFDGETWQVFNGTNSILPSEIALFIEEDNNGTLWVSFGNTYTGILASYNGNEWNIYDKSILYNLTSRISGIVSINDGSVWFGTHDKGLICYKDSVWTGFTTENSEIPINQIICMKKDKENNLWMGHRNGLTKMGIDEINGFSINEDVVLKISPNPITKHAEIFIPGGYNKSFSLEVINVKGQVLRVENKLPNRFLFEKKELHSGMYFIKIFNSEKVFIKKVILI